MRDDVFTAYGEIALDRVDVRALECMSIDLRPETGHSCPDESCVLRPPHQFELSVIKPVPGELPIGEIRFWLHDKEIRLVGKLTGRSLFEVTPDLLMAAKADENYLHRIRQWLGLAA